MPLHLTPDTVGEAIARIEDLLEFHGGAPMWRYQWHHLVDAVRMVHEVTAYLPPPLAHPDAYGDDQPRITVIAFDLHVALSVLGDKVAEAVNFKAAS